MILEGTILKLPNLTRAERTALVFAVTAFLLPGCDSTEDPPAETASAETGSQTTDTETTDATETDPTTDVDTDTTDPGTTTAGDTEETTGTPIEGLGCDPAPACDKGVYEGSPTITTIEEANDIAGYTGVTGRLAIANSDFECLTFLSCMESVGHDLTLFGNDVLTDVTGLDNVVAIGAITDGPLMPGGTLTVSENAALVDFNTLNLIEQTPISLSISENDSLEAITGLKTLVGTQVHFEIRANPVLNEIPGDSLRDMLFIGGNCVVTANTNLCISTIEDMCSLGLKVLPQDGSTTLNDNSC